MHHDLISGHRFPFYNDEVTIVLLNRLSPNSS
jgi:hypothetical protein